MMETALTGRSNGLGQHRRPCGVCNTDLKCLEVNEVVSQQQQALIADMVYIMGGYYLNSSKPSNSPQIHPTSSVLAISIQDLYSARDLYNCSFCNDTIPGWQSATPLKWPFGGFATATMRYAALSGGIL